MSTRRAFALSLSALLTKQPFAASQTERPESLVWGDRNIAWMPDDPPGAKYAVLDGDREDPGSIFSYAFWLPGGVWAPPHAHSQSAHVAVLKGALRLGFGPSGDRSKTVVIPAGEFFVVRADMVHYEGSEGECLIVGTARGGWKTTVVG